MGNRTGGVSQTYLSNNALQSFTSHESLTTPETSTSEVFSAESALVADLELGHICRAAMWVVFWGCARWPFAPGPDRDRFVHDTITSPGRCAPGFRGEDFRMSDAMSARVSVVIPTHNRAHLIQRALRSVLEQTVQDWECFVVDDGSVDDTESVVRAIGDARVQYLRHPVNRGGSAARNTGIRAAQGKWVGFLDSDDEWLPRKLERQLAQLEASELPDLALVYSGFTTVRGDSETPPTAPVYRGRVFDQLLRSNVIGSTSLALVRRDVLLALGGFDEALPAKQDVDLWLRLARDHQVDFVPEPLVRMHEGRGERRITTDGAGRVIARERFFEKYGAELRAAGMAHEYHCRTGLICLRHLRDPTAARRWYREALQERPAHLPAYAMIGASLLPMELQDWIAGGSGGWDDRGLRSAGWQATPPAWSSGRAWSRPAPKGRPKPGAGTRDSNRPARRTYRCPPGARAPAPQSARSAEPCSADGR
jgi:glycosyltransferase involved in cell wall biosynthesis